MCIPIDPLLVDRKGSVLLNKLVMELHHAWGEMQKEPRFVDNPQGLGLNDIVHNADHAIGHIQSAVHIISIMNKGGFIKEEGGE